MQEIIIDGSILFSITVSLISISISIAVFFHSRNIEKTRKKERTIDALSRCRTLLEEAIEMHPSLDYPVGFVMKDEFADEINKKADTLTELSWTCKDLGEDILEGALILKSTVRVRYAADKEYLSNRERKESLEKISNLRDKVGDHLKELSQ